MTVLFSASLTTSGLMESWIHCSLSHELRGIRKLRSVGYYVGEKATEQGHFVPASGPQPWISGDQLLIQGCVPR